MTRPKKTQPKKASPSRRKNSTAVSEHANSRLKRQLSGAGGALTAQNSDGFFYRLGPRRGVGSDEADAFEGRLHEYLEMHRLQHEGGPLRAWVSCADDEMAPEECMDFVSWIAGESAIVHFAASGIQSFPAQGFPGAFRISVSTKDPVLAAVLTLYHSHRIGAELALELLDVAAPFVSSPPLDRA